MLVLHHHPYTRAATAVRMLEELGQPYTLHYVDLLAGEHKEDPHKISFSSNNCPGGTVICSSNSCTTKVLLIVMLHCICNVTQAGSTCALVHFDPGLL